MDRDSPRLHKPFVPAPSRWIRNPWWDAFWIQSGWWLSVVAVVAAVVDGLPVATWLEPLQLPPLHPETLSTAWLGTLGLFLALPLWIGHRLSSLLVAWTVPSYRAVVIVAPLRWLVVPALIVVAVVVWLLPAFDALWPWTWENRVLVAAVVDYVLVTHHFAAQHAGVLALYRRRAGGDAHRDRGAHWRFALGIGGGLVVVADILVGSAVLPVTFLEAMAPYALPLGCVGVVVVVGSALMLLARPRRRPRGPTDLYVGSVVVMVLLALLLHPLVFVVVWAGQHWLTAIGLGTLVARPAPSSTLPSTLPSSTTPHFWERFHRRRGAFTILLIATSLLLFPFLEIEASRDGSRLPSLDMVGIVFDPSGAVVAGLVTLGFATAFLHYAMDRAVYRFGDPNIRAAAAALLKPPAL